MPSWYRGKICLNLDNDSFFGFPRVISHCNRRYQFVTGLSEDAARYHARAWFEKKETIKALNFEEWKKEVSLVDFCSKFDLPDP